MVSEEFPDKGFVSKVIDGDTVIINGESVRLLGIDSDERGYPCYNAAKKRIEELVLNKEVVLEKDNEDKDQYQRYLRYLFLDGGNIGLQMVEEGLAVSRFSPENRKYKDEILNAEIEARENQVGCKWGESEDGAELDEEKADADEAKDSKKEESENSSLDYECGENTYNCGDFLTQKEAQEVFDFCFPEHGDVHALDKNKDGEACESLPK